MFSQLSTGQKLLMLLIAGAINSACCVAYAFFIPGPHVLLYFIASVMLLIMSLLGGFFYSIYRPQHFFIATIIALFVVAALYTILVENVFMFLPLSLFSLILAYLMVRQHSEK